MLAFALGGAARADSGHDGQGALIAPAAGHGEHGADEATPEDPHAGHAPAPAAPADGAEQDSHGIHDDADGRAENPHAAEATAPKERPRALVLGGFVGINAAILTAAALVRLRDLERRRRPA